jgi:hypothetical protein
MQITTNNTHMLPIDSFLKQCILYNPLCKTLHRNFWSLSMFPTNIVSKTLLSASKYWFTLHTVIKIDILEGLIEMQNNYHK